MNYEKFNLSHALGSEKEVYFRRGRGKSSTLNLPEATPNTRFNGFNTERCVSTPHNNITGFIDGNFEDNRGTRLEYRIRTRSREGSNSIDMKLREDFTQLKMR